MAKVIGKLTDVKKRKLLHNVTAAVSTSARLQAELEEGHGPHLLAERLRSLDLPDDVTIILRPTLSFLNADIGIVAPGKILIINALHWAGDIGQGKKGQWTGAGGRVDLGRPDRRAHIFCDRLAYSGLGRGFEPQAVVVFTGGAVRYLGEEPQATLVQWAELEEFLRKSLPSGVAGFSDAQLIQAITPR